VQYNYIQFRLNLTTTDDLPTLSSRFSCPLSSLQQWLFICRLRSFW